MLDLNLQRILKKYAKHQNINIIWLKKNKRAGFCRNLAIRNSKSEYIAFIDSDDIWEKEKLSKQLEFMIKNKYHFTYTNYLPYKSEKEQNKLNEINLLSQNLIMDQKNIENIKSIIKNEEINIKI